MTARVANCAKGTQASGTTATTASVTTTAAGSIFVAVLFTKAAITGLSFSDAKGNSWSARITALSAGGTGLVYVSNSINGTGGAAHTLTANWTGASAAVLYLIECTGCETAVASDGLASTTDASSPFSSSNITPTTPPSILIGMVGGDSVSTAATHAMSNANPATGWLVEGEESNGSVLPACIIVSQRVGGSSTWRASMTEAGSASAAAITMAYKELAGGVANVTPIAWQRVNTLLRM